MRGKRESGEEGHVYENPKGKRFIFWVAYLEKFYDLQSKECELQKPSTPINPIEAHRI